MKVAFTGAFGHEERRAWRAALAQACPGIVFVEAWEPGDAIEAAVVANPAAGALAGLPALRLIQSLWAGVDRVLADTTLPADVPLARMVDPSLNEAMAETALWAVLALHRRFFDYAAQQRAAQWVQLDQRRADELRVLVLGLGAMGASVATRLAAHGYRVTAWRQTAARAAPAGVVALDGAAAWPAALARADVLVNLLPLTPQTRGLLDARCFAQLPRGASVVNLARGAHVNDADLLAALDSGHLHRAVLDVFHQEPLPADHPFWRHPRVTVLPHAAALTDPRSAAQVVAENLRRLRAGEPLMHLVDRRRGY